MLIKIILDLAEKTPLFGSRVRLEVVRLRELLQQFFFFFAELLRYPNVDVDEHVAAAITVEYGQAFASQSQHFAALRAWGNLYPHLAVDGGHFSLGAQDGFGDGDEQVVDQRAFVALKFWVGFLFDEDEQVAVDAVVWARIALAAHGKLHAFAYASRDVNVNDFTAFHDALTAAVRAFFLMTVPFPSQVGHTEEVCICPKKLLMVCITLPRP